MAETYPVSVIIPAYNAVEYLKRCLPALRENDLDNVEVIIVDDASSDNLEGFLESSRHLSWVRVLRCARRGGPAAARNLGASQASHPFLFFLDADVVLPHNCIRWMRESIDLYSHREDVAGVLGGYSEEISTTGFLTNFKNLSTCFLYWITETQSPYLHTPIFLIRRDVFEGQGGFDPRLQKAEDFRLGVALGSKGYRFIIDRRIKGEHLKAYRLFGLLKENWGRILSLRSIRLAPEEKQFSYRAHRWSRLLSVLLPAPATAALVAGAFWPGFLWLGAAMVGLFLLANLRFLLYLRKWRGALFAVGSLGFFFIEMLFGQAALAVSLVLPRSQTV